MKTGQLRTIERPSRISVIINPAAGRPRPILHTINEQLAEVDWCVDVTRKRGDARKFAAEAVSNGAEMIVVYGGDGTLMEVVDGVAGSSVPILPLHGGTGNLVANELHIPSKMEHALGMITAPTVHLLSVDLGIINGKSRFILRCGCGLEAETLIRTGDYAKIQWGKVAYVQGLLKALSRQKTIDFRIWIDDAPEPMERKGVTLTVANAGLIGWGDLRITPYAEISDGLLDVCLVRRAALESAVEFFKITSQLKPGNHGFDSSSPVQYEQARRVRVETVPAVKYQADGDLMGETPFEATIDPVPLWVVAKPQLHRK